MSFCSRLALVLLCVLAPALTVQAALPKECGAMDAPALAKQPGRNDLSYDLALLLPDSGLTLAQAQAQAAHLRLDADSVLIEAVVSPDRRQGAADALTALGAEVTAVSQVAGLVQAWLPLAALDDTTQHDALPYLRAPVLVDMDVLPIELPEPALAASHATAWHAACERGEGVKVMVIDGAFGGYVEQIAVTLPATVTARTLVDNASLDDMNTGDRHGTACAEVIHAMAPGADLILAQVATMLDLEEAVAWAIAEEVDIISTSIHWMCQTPGDGTGFFADLATTAREAGILWVTSSGDQALNHWFGPWVDDDGNNFCDLLGHIEILVLFDEPDSPRYLEAGRLVKFGIRWDAWEPAIKDIDLYLVRIDDNGLEVVTEARSYQNGSPGQAPFEVASIITYGEPAQYGVAVERHIGAVDLEMDLYAISDEGPLLGTQPDRSLPDLATAPDAVTVAAVGAAAPYALLPGSGRGPLKGPGGSTSPAAIKPDLAGYTALAAPHVAGAAALVMGAFPALSVDEVEALLVDRALDLGDPGVDASYGAGRLWLGDVTAEAPTSTPAHEPAGVRCALPMIAR